MSREIVELRHIGRKCIFCEALAASENVQVESFNYKTDEGRVVELTADVPVISCSSCGEQYTDDRAECIRHEAVCRFLGRLTPVELRLIRERYGYSQKQWSDITGIGLASIKRWESGALIQGQALDRFVRVLRNPRGYQLLKDVLAPGHFSPNLKIFQTDLSAHTIKDASAFQLRVEKEMA